MRLYLAEEYDKDGNCHWLVSGESPNSGNALDCGADRQLADQLIEAAKERCQCPGCDKPGVFEVFDTNDHLLT